MTELRYCYDCGCRIDALSKRCDKCRELRNEMDRARRARLRAVERVVAAAQDLIDGRITIERLTEIFKNEGLA